MYLIITGHPLTFCVFCVYRAYMENREFLSSLRYYTRARTTWKVENFFSHGLLKYCSKRIGFTYDVYVMRNQLAVLDHNMHVGRLPAQNMDGSVRIQAQVSRRTKAWVAYMRLSDKPYNYIPGICHHQNALAKLHYNDPLNKDIICNDNYDTHVTLLF